MYAKPSSIFSKLVLAVMCMAHYSFGAALSVTDTLVPRQDKIKKVKHIELKMSSEQIQQVKSGSKSLVFCIETIEGQASWTLTGIDTRNTLERLPKQIAGRAKPRVVEVAAIRQDSNIWRDIQASGSLFVTVSNLLDADHEVNLLFSAVTTDSIMAPMGSHYVMNVEGLREITILTNVVVAEGNHHYKFLVEGQKSKPGSHFLTVTGQISSPNITTPLPEFPFLRFDQDKVGYVLDSSDPQYCRDSTCNYAIRCKFDNLKTLEFYLGEHIDLEFLAGSEHTIGYIRENSTKFNVYSYKLLKPETVAFTLIPIEGYAELLVNPSFFPKEDSQFYYQSRGSIAKRIIVSKRDLLGMGVNQTQIFVKIACEHACRYILKSNSLDNGVLDIKPGYSEIGTMDGGEIRSHLLLNKDYAGELTQKRFTVKLQLYNGEANLFIKNCPPKQRCEVTQAELTAANSTLANGIIAHRGVKAIKQIIYPVVCSNNRSSANTSGTTPSTSPAPSSDSTSNTTETIASQQVVSATCTFLVVIQGNSPDKQTKIKYELSIEDDLDRHLMNLNHVTYIKLLDNQTRNYTFINNHPKLNSPLEMVFDGKFGAFKTCVKIVKAGQTFTPDKVCDQQKTVDANYAGVDQSLYKMQFPAGEAATYYIEITATENTALNFGIHEIDPAQNQAFLAKDIKAGLAYSDALRSADVPSFYTFELQSEEVNSVYISLVPIHGNFRIVARNDDVRPTKDQTFWISDTNSLLISKRDRQFSTAKRFTVGVFTLNGVDGNSFVDAEPSSGGDDVPKTQSTERFKFQIKWGYTGKHSVLIPGIPDYTRLTDAETCFVIEIYPGWKEVLIAKHSPSRTLDMFVSVGKVNSKPNPQNFDFKSLGDHSGLYLTSEQITSLCSGSFRTGQHCNAYLCMFGSKNDEIQIGFTYDNKPFTLQEGRAFHAPLPTGENHMHFLYHPSNHSAVDVEEFSNSYMVEMTAALVEEPQSGAIAFPNVTIDNTTMYHRNSLVHFTQESIQKLSKPLIAISVGKPKSRVDMFTKDTEPYQLGSFISIEAGFFLKELVKSTKRTGELQRNGIVYYYFYNHHPSLPIYIGLDSLNGGDADIVLGRGKDARPSTQRHIAMSVGYRSGYILYSLKQSRGGGHKDLSGYYVVGVQANSDIKFNLVWRHARNTVEYPSFDQMITTTVPAKGQANFVLYNPYVDDIFLELNAHHRSAVVYMSSSEINANNRVNDLESFPSTERHTNVFHVSREHSLTRIKIDKTAPGYCSNCKLLFSVMGNNDGRSFPLDYKLMVGGVAGQYYTTDVHASQTVEVAGGPELPTKYIVLLSEDEIKGLNDSYIEMHVVAGHGKILITDKFEPDLTKFFQVNEAFRTGFNMFKLNNLSISTEPSFLGGINRGRVFNGRLYVNFVCETSCQFRFSLVVPAKMSAVQVNKPIEGFMATGSKVNTYLYHSTGKEAIFDVNFVISALWAHDKNLNTNTLNKLLRVHFFKDKSNLNISNLTSVKAKYTHSDIINGRMNLEFKPRKGFFVVEVRPSFLHYNYRLEINTDHVSTLLPGRRIVSHVGLKNVDHIYDIITATPGGLFLKMEVCYGKVGLSVRSNGTKNDSYDHISINPDQYTNIWSTREPGEQVFLKVQKAPMTGEEQPNGYLDHTKQVSIYSLEVFESQAYNKMPFEHIVPSNRDTFMDFTHSKPQLVFRPIKYHGHRSNPIKDIRYFAVVSRDPEMLDFYAGCGHAFLKHAMKKNFKPTDAVQIYRTGYSPEVKKEVGTDNEYITMELNITSGNKYFVTVVAVVRLLKPEDTTSFFTSEDMRYRYPTVEFEYKSFFYPLELLSATLGLIAVALGSCILVNERLQKMFGFLLHKKSADGKSGVDRDLEEYYMQIKNDFDFEERVRTESSGDRTVNTSAVLDSPDTSRYGREAELEERPKPKSTKKPSREVTIQIDTQKTTGNKQSTDSADQQEEDLFEEEPNLI